MRFLGIGDAADLAALYIRLAEDGHDVKVFIGNALCQDTLGGLVCRTSNWRSELAWVRKLVEQPLGIGTVVLQPGAISASANDVEPIAPQLVLAAGREGCILLRECRRRTRGFHHGHKDFILCLVGLMSMMTSQMAPFTKRTNFTSLCGSHCIPRNVPFLSKRKRCAADSGFKRTRRKLVDAEGAGKETARVERWLELNEPSIG